MTQQIYALYNIKGGVGKTASAVNLAYISALEGYRTLLWDLDPQGAASFYFRLEPKIRGGGKKLIEKKRKLHRHIRGSDFDGLDVIPADFSYRHMDLDLDATRRGVRRLARLLAPLAGEYDHVYLDCPPSISLVSESVFVAARALLVPTLPTPLSLRTLDQLRRHLAETGREDLRLLPFLCMADHRKRLHRHAFEERDSAFLKTRIPYASQVEQMGIHRLPLHAFAGGSPAARAYRELWQEIHAPPPAPRSTP